MSQQNGSERPGPQTDSASKNDSKAESAEETCRQQAFLPQINFSTFVMSLNASALVHLGAIEDPASGSKNRNLDLGKQTIDVLAMLEERTHGNLTADEEGLLKNILYDLRMQYVREKC